jgi:hypothetical protein
LSWIVNALQHLEYICVHIDLCGFITVLDSLLDRQNGIEQATVAENIKQFLVDAEIYSHYSWVYTHLRYANRVRLGRVTSSTKWKLHPMTKK